MAGKTRKAAVTITMKETHYFPGEVHYIMIAEIPGEENQAGTVVRDFEGNIKMHKESECHPGVKRMMISEIKNYMARVHLD